jgi:hypothetical protein
VNPDVSKQSRRENRRDREGRGQARGHATEAVTYAMTVDSSKEAITAARKQTHDQLIAMLGKRRRGPVRWAIIKPDDVTRALDQLQSFEAAAPSEGDVTEDEGFEAMRVWHAEYPDGYLVVARALGEP